MREQQRVTRTRNAYTREPLMMEVAGGVCACMPRCHMVETHGLGEHGASPTAASNGLLQPPLGACSSAQALLLHIRLHSHVLARPPPWPMAGAPSLIVNPAQVLGIWQRAAWRGAGCEFDGDRRDGRGLDSLLADAARLACARWPRPRPLSGRTV